MNSPRHRILKRQMKRHLSEQAISAPDWQDFFAAVSRAYTDFDEDRELLDRSLELSSKEFVANNRRLEETRQAVERQAQTLAREVARRTKELNKRVAELEDVRRAMTNLLEDFTEKQRALTIAKAKDEALLASLGEGMIAVDQAGKVTVINKIAEELLGFADAQIMGKPLVPMTPLEDELGNQVINAQRPITLALASGKTTAATYYVTRKDGTKFPIVLTVAPVRLGDEVIGAIEVFRDVTRDQEIDQMKTDFINVAAHDLRTPITAVKGFTQMILRGDFGPIPDGEISEALRDIEEGADRMVNIINDYLTMSRIRLGNFTIVRKKLDVATLIKRAVGEVAMGSSGRPIKIIQRVGEEVPPIAADQSKLLQVLVNLLDNALKFTEQGTITVKAESTDTLVKISVSDTGTGIPADKLPRLFEPYYKGKAGVAAGGHGGGLGLGLNICKIIVEAHGGQIGVASEPGKGSTFFFTLPITGDKL